MEKSKLENVDDKLLVTISRLILEDYVNDVAYDVITDVFEYEQVYDAYIDNLRNFGIKGETIDVDFLKNFISMNRSELEDEEYTGGFKRPEVKQYAVDVRVGQTAYQTITYRHSASSYSKETVREKMIFEDNNGITSVWEGREIDMDTYDTETNDINWGKPFEINNK